VAALDTARSASTLDLRMALSVAISAYSLDLLSLEAAISASTAVVLSMGS